MAAAQPPKIATQPFLDYSGSSQRGDSTYPQATPAFPSLRVASTWVQGLGFRILGFGV